MRGPLLPRFAWRWAPRTDPPVLGTCVALLAALTALQVVLCAAAGAWVEFWLVSPSFGCTALAWYAFERQAEAEARLATRRMELRIDVPEHSVMVVQHRSAGPAMITTPVGKVSCS